jgi:hypothetical protein
MAGAYPAGDCFNVTFQWITQGGVIDNTILKSAGMPQLIAEDETAWSHSPGMWQAWCVKPATTA